MKKIPTLFAREFDNHKVISISREVPPELQWVLDGEGIATEKIDGACCTMINGVFYKRYDAKKDKNGNMKLPPEDAIPCDDPDPVTGHWPHWVKVEENNPADHWFLDALHYAQGGECILPDATYEAIGPHFQSNPYHLEQDMLVRHGAVVIELNNRSFEGIRSYLQKHAVEGIVFWKDGKPQCKIKRKDFGFKWPITQAEIDEEQRQRREEIRRKIRSRLNTQSASENTDDMCVIRPGDMEILYPAVEFIDNTCSLQNRSGSTYEEIVEKIREEGMLDYYNRWHTDGYMVKLCGMTMFVAQSEV